MIVECTSCHLRHEITGRRFGTRLRCSCGEELTLSAASAEAESLACPQCGAGCGASQTRCEYCGTELATVRCQRCFALLFRGSKHCTRCGAPSVEPVAAEAPDEDVPRQCPRCARDRATDLVAQSVGDTLIDACPECGGLWIDQQAFERITSTEAQVSALRAIGAFPPPRRKLSREAVKVVYLRCPVCGTVMNRRNYARRSGIIIDVCLAHGIWFDRHELTHVIEFVRRGGLEQGRPDDVEPLPATPEAELLGQIRELRARFFENERLFARSGSSPIERLFRALSVLFE